MKVYLAGCKGVWRLVFKKALPLVEFVDPFEDSNQKTLATFTVDDLKAIGESDMMIVYIGYPVYTGACVEAGFAHASGKPIWLIWELRQGRMDPLLLGISQKVFTNLQSAVQRFEKEKAKDGSGYGEGKGRDGAS